MWYFYNIEMKVLQSIENCAPGTFYLITGVENYKQFIYTNSTNRVEERIEGKKLEPGQFSFPKTIWVAGCCIPNSSHLDSTPKRYFGYAFNPKNGNCKGNKVGSIWREYKQRQKFPLRQVMSVFKDTVCDENAIRRA